MSPISFATITTYSTFRTLIIQKLAKDLQRVLVKDSKLGEKLAAVDVMGAMRLKRELGSGLKIKKKGGAEL